jgi:hypothetical protein
MHQFPALPKARINETVVDMAMDDNVGMEESAFEFEEVYSSLLLVSSRPRRFCE